MPNATLARRAPAAQTAAAGDVDAAALRQACQMIDTTLARAAGAALARAVAAGDVDAAAAALRQCPAASFARVDGEWIAFVSRALGRHAITYQIYKTAYNCLYATPRSGRLRRVTQL